MRNKLFLYATLLLAFVGLSSCSEDSNVVDEFSNWQSKNDAFYKNLTDSVKQLIANGNSDWKLIKTWSIEDSLKTKLTDSICVHILSSGTSTSGSPFYNDSVRVHYLGRILPSANYPEGFVFDRSYYGTYNPETSVPSSLLVSGVIAGFTTALMNMHIGDHWLVYIPYDLAYGGSTSSSSIPAYSTLIFDITLVSFYRVGVDVPDYKSKANMWVDE